MNFQGRASPAVVIGLRHMRELLNKHPLKLIKIECFEFDKYGRLLINVWNMVDIDTINDIMIKEGHCKVYDGGTKKNDG